MYQGTALAVPKRVDMNSWRDWPRAKQAGKGALSARIVVLAFSVAAACSAQQPKQPFCISGRVQMPEYPREALIRHMDGHVEINLRTGEPIGKSAGPMNDLMREAAQKMVHELKIQGEGNVLIDYKVDEAAPCGGLVRASFFDSDRIEIVSAPECLSPKTQTRRLISMNAPRFPPLARTARIFGTVKIKADITPDGRISKLALEEGHRLLQQAAMDAALSWQFSPSAETTSIIAGIEFAFNDDSPLPVDDIWPCGFTFTSPYHLRVLAGSVQV